MKKFLFLTLFGAVMTLHAQQYKITGKAPQDARFVYLRSGAAQNQTPDSVKIGADGAFSIEGTVKGSGFADIYSDSKTVDVLPIVLDGNVTVDLVGGTLAGTAENEGLSALQQQLKPYNQQMQQASDEYSNLMKNGGNVTPEQEEALSQRYEQAYNAYNATVKEACETHPKNIFPAYYVSRNFYSLDKADLIRWYDADAAFMKVKELARIKDFIEGWRKQLPGVKFTDLEEPDADGKMHKLSEYVGNGNYVLVDFWASWCGPCMQEMPNVKKLYEKYHAKGFNVVGLSFDNKKENWQAAVKRLEMSWPQLSDLQGWGSVAGKTYGVSSIPFTLLVAPDGTILANSLRGEELAKKLQEIYRE